MTDAEEMKALLHEILEVQKAHFELYQRVAERSLAIQDLSIERQAKAVFMQRVALWVLFGIIGLGGAAICAGMVLSAFR